MTRPELLVDVARSVDTPRTDSSTWQWHEVSADVELQEGLSVQFGRQDKVNQADPNTLALTFAAAQYEQDSGGPYATLRDTGREIRKGTPIRVQAVPDGVVGNYLNAAQSTFPLATAAWTAGGSVPPALSISAVRAQEGSTSLLITWGTAGTLPLAQTTVTGLTIGRTYTASAYAYVPTGDPAVLLVAATSTAFGVAMSTKNAFTRFTVTFTATATTELLQLWPNTAPTAGDQCWLDAVQVWHGTSAVTFSSVIASDALRGRFYGFVDSLNVSWPSGNVEYPEVAVTALSRLGIIGRARNIQDATSAAVLAAGATSYWAMSEETPGSGTTHPTSPPWFSDDQPLIHVDNVQGINLVRYGWPPAANGQPPPDGLNVGSVYARNLATLGAVVLQIEGRVGEIPANTAWSASVMIRVPPDAAATSPTIVPLAGYNLTETLWTAGYRVEWLQAGDVIAWTIATYNSGPVDFFIGESVDLRDGLWHLVTLTVSSAANPVLRVYLDGAEVVSGTATMSSIPIQTVTTGDYLFVASTYANQNPRFEVGRLAVYEGTLLSAGNVSDLYDAIFVGQGEQTVSDRMALWFDYAGVPATDWQIVGASEVTLLPQSPVGASPLSLLQDVTATDGGVLFDRTLDAVTRLYTRAHRLDAAAAAAAVTLDATTEEVSADLAAFVDPAEIINSVTVKAADNSLSIIREDTTSQDAHGFVGHEETLLNSSLAYLQPRADWLIYTRKDPRVRAPALSVQVEALSGSQQAGVLSLEPDSLVAVSGLPSEVDGVPSAYFVEGGSEDWSPEGCKLTLNTTDAAFEQGTFVLDDTTRGDLDSVYVLA